MGIHTGRAEARDGDYYGTAVNRAARLMSLANGGQIVVSLATEELTADELSDDVSFVDLGEARLRDLSRPERVFQLIGKGIESDFPPLRSLDAYATNLPTFLSSFVGRETELAEVAAALTGSRLVTLTGVGGIGKTRLALHAAADLLPRHRDGVWLCELAPVGDPGAIVEALAGALGVRPRMGQSLDASLLDFLRAKDLLLILDNCEHLLDPVAQLVGQILQASQKVSVLATSREGLALAGERVVALRSLDVQSDAITLFVDRARHARSDFEVTTANSGAVEQVCSRLDGIPLAIELAAARVQAMTPAEIAARLDDQFRLLSSARSAVERHQTLRRTIDWSYDLLTDWQRCVLQRLSVFAGGCSLDAAEAVTAGDGIDGPDVLEHLAALVRRSLVIADQIGDQTRYRLLETIRQYSQERLEASGDSLATGRRHANYCSLLAVEAAPHLRGGDQLTWISRLEPEIDNLRAALAWSLDHGHLDLALPLVTSVCVDGTALGYMALTWAETVAAHPGVDDHRRAPALLARAAWSAVFRTQLDVANEYEARRVAVEARLVLPVNPANFQAPATIALLSGDMEAATQRAREWIDAARATGDRYEVVQGLTLLAAALVEHAEAVPAAEDAVEQGRRLGNPSSLSWALTTLGLRLTFAGDLARAIPIFEEAIALGTTCGNEQGVGAALGGLAMARVQLGDQRGALATYLASIEQQARIGERFTFVPNLVGIAVILAALGAHEEAAMLHGAADAMRGVAGWVGQLADERRDAITAASEALGHARFADLYQRGGAMNADEAIEFARDAAAPFLGIDET